MHLSFMRCMSESVIPSLDRFIFLVVIHIFRKRLMGDIRENFLQWRLKLHLSLSLNLIRLQYVHLHPLGSPYTKNHGHIMSVDHWSSGYKINGFPKTLLFKPMVGWANEHYTLWFLVWVNPRGWRSTWCDPI